MCENNAYAYNLNYVQNIFSGGAKIPAFPLVTGQKWLDIQDFTNLTAADFVAK